MAFPYLLVFNTRGVLEPRRVFFSIKSNTSHSVSQSVVPALAVIDIPQELLKTIVSAAFPRLLQSEALQGGAVGGPRDGHLSSLPADSWAHGSS